MSAPAMSLSTLTPAGFTPAPVVPPPTPRSVTPMPEVATAPRRTVSSLPPPSPMRESCKKPCEDPCKKVDPCDPCAAEKQHYMHHGWGWLGALILWFIIFTVLFWLIYYSLKPGFVLQSGTNQVDTAKVLLAAVITSLVVVIVIWLIKIAVTRQM